MRWQLVVRDGILNIMLQSVAFFRHMWCGSCMHGLCLRQQAKPSASEGKVNATGRFVRTMMSGQITKWRDKQ